MLFQDVMVDIETTGTSPDRTGILQIAAVPFNLAEMAISPDVFDRCLALPPHRMWSEGTRTFWSEQKAEILQDILDRREPADVVMNAFFNWACNVAPNLRFWAKPTSFDFPFTSSYFEDYELPNPFHYRLARDVNTFIEARHFPNQVPKIETTAKTTHNALDDCYAQIELVFRHYAATRRREAA